MDKYKQGYNDGANNRGPANTQNWPAPAREKYDAGYSHGRNKK